MALWVLAMDLNRSTVERYINKINLKLIFFFIRHCSAKMHAYPHTTNMISKLFFLPLVLASKVEVKVLVESYCPCSGAWEASFQDFLIPTLGSIIDLERIYDAGATGTQGCCNPSADQSEVHCMHGLEECVADSLQRCAQELYPVWNQWLNYTYCIQGDCENRPDAAGCKSQFIVGKDENLELEKQCAEEQNLDYDALTTCWQGEEGVSLMQSDADKCDHLGIDYGMHGLPTVWVNNVLFSTFFDCDGSTDKYIQSLTQAICDANTIEPAPSVCA